MNEEIYCITSEGRMANNEWENDDWLSMSTIPCT